METENTTTWCPNVDKFRNEKRKVFKALEGMDSVDACIMLESVIKHISQNCCRNGYSENGYVTAQKVIIGKQI